MQIGNLVASSASTITINWVPEFIVIESVDLDLPITQFTATVAAVPRQNSTAQARLQAMSKYLMNGLLGADVKVGAVMKLSNGFVPEQTTQLQFTNGAATTPAVYAFSTAAAEDGVEDVIDSGETTIQASSNSIFEAFTALIFSETNLQYVDITFADGHNEQLSAAEIAALFITRNIADADGKLAGQLVIDNADETIINAKIYTTSGGTLTVQRIDI